MSCARQDAAYAVVCAFVYSWVCITAPGFPGLKVRCTRFTLWAQVFIRREPDAFHVPHATAEPAAHHSPDVIGPQVVTAPYRISNVVPACPHISAVLLRELLEAGGRVEAPVVEALNASADSFYSSQVKSG